MTTTRQKPTLKDMAIALHDAGRTVVEIARSLGCDPHYVADVLTAAGKPAEFTPKDRGESSCWRWKWKLHPNPLFVTVGTGTGNTYCLSDTSCNCPASVKCAHLYGLEARGGIAGVRRFIEGFIEGERPCRCQPK